MTIGLGEQVLWYDTSRCNLNCPGCFREDGLEERPLKERMRLAGILIDNHVKQVIFGNGEPLLVSGLEEILGMLHSSGIKTEIHTNGTILDERMIDRLAPVTDVIAVPMDAVNPEVQKRIRGRAFMPTFYRLDKLAEQAQEAGMKVGYHSIFSAVNREEMQDILSRLAPSFEYWRVYEFNDNLPRSRLLRLPKSAQRRIGYREIRRRWEEIEALSGFGTEKKGYTDCTFAYFLLIEERMKKLGDERIQFVGVHDPNKVPYLFLDGRGNARTYAWFSINRRPWMGNVLRDGFPSILSRLRRLQREQMEYCARAEEDFVETEAQRPLWARVWEGNFFSEELEEVDPHYREAFNRLANIYIRRQKKLMKAKV